MKYYRIWLLSLLLIIASKTYSIEQYDVDICIYGATSAGVIASYSAQMYGKRVLLIEPSHTPGGMSSSGLGFTDIGNKYVVKGLARDFYRRLGAHYGKLEQWIFEPSVADSLFRDYIDRSEVEVLYGYRLKSVRKTKTSIRSIMVENSDVPSKRSDRMIKAKVFIDCSYEGDLMAQSGVSYTVGRESNSLYNETFNGVQWMNGHQFPDGIDPYRIKGDPSSGLLWGISSDELLPNGTGDQKVQAYNYRICLTDRAENKVDITRPDNYDASRYELLIRLKELQPWKSLFDIFIWQIMPNRKTDINNFGGFSTDMIGMNWNYPEASYQERRQIVKAHEDYTKGLLYFLGHDGRIPPHVQQEMLRWGYPKDEYLHNGHWPAQLYIRESRRMIGQTVMTQHHCQGEETVSDPIAWAAYTMDSHNCDRHVVNGMVKNEGNVEEGGFPPYPISYRSIVPQIDQCDNLLVPVCMSASHIAYGSIRMEPVFMVLGQSAAVAASLAIDQKMPVQKIDVATLERMIRENPLADGSHPEILIDNDSKDQTLISGEWETVYDTYRGYGSNFLVDHSPLKQAKSVRYTPDIVHNGRYALYLYMPELAHPSAQSCVTVFDGTRSCEIWITPSDLKLEGQTLGEWIPLGEYELSSDCQTYVEISNKGADNSIAADAVLFLPIR